MTQQLATQNATITTAAIKIQTLTIGRKQVTLAVFRQLREEPLVAEGGTLNGVPWGIVNYHPEKCSGNGHWHIVWQRGDELLRSRIDRTAPYGKFWSETGDKFISAHVREVLEGRGRHLGGTMPPFDSDGCATLRNAAPFPVELSRDDELSSAIYEWKAWQSAIQNAKRNPNLAYHASAIEECRKRLARRVEELSSAAPEPHEVDELYEALMAELEMEETRRKRHREARMTLAELPQLFIAV